MSKHTAELAKEARRMADDRAAQLTAQYGGQRNSGAVRITDTQAELIADMAEHIHRLAELVEPLG